MNKKTEKPKGKGPFFSGSVRIVLGWLLVVPGFFLFITPIPVGIFMLTAGFLLLHSASPRFRQTLMNLASRFPGIAQKMKMESILDRMNIEDNGTSSDEDQKP